MVTVDDKARLATDKALIATDLGLPVVPEVVMM